MSRTIHIHHYDENAFISQNPWFELAVLSRIERQLDSDRLKHKIRDEMENRFANLLRRELQSEPLWNHFKGKLETTTMDGIARINHAVDIKAKELYEDKQFTSLQTGIHNAAMERFDMFKTSLKDRQDLEERERNKRLEKMEARVRDFENGQSRLFWSGLVLGAGIGFGASLISKM